MNKTFFSFFLAIFMSQILFGQEYSVYKSKIDTSFVSLHQMVMEKMIPG
jgi:hypothetical protein